MHGCNCVDKVLYDLIFQFVICRRRSGLRGDDRTGTGPFRRPATTIRYQFSKPGRHHGRKRADTDTTDTNTRRNGWEPSDRTTFDQLEWLNRAECECHRGVSTPRTRLAPVSHEKITSLRRDCDGRSKTSTAMALSTSRRRRTVRHLERQQPVPTGARMITRVTTEPMSGISSGSSSPRARRPPMTLMAMDFRMPTSETLRRPTPG